MNIQESSPTMYKGDDHKSPVGTPRLSPVSWSVLGRENDLLVGKNPLDIGCYLTVCCGKWPIYR